MYHFIRGLALFQVLCFLEIPNSVRRLEYGYAAWEGTCTRYCHMQYLPGRDSGKIVSIWIPKYDPEIFLNRREKLRQVLEVLHADRTILSVVQFDPVVPEVNMVHGYLKVPYDECMAAVEKVESITGIKILSRV